MRQHHITDETNKKGNYNLSLRKNIIISKTPIQSGIKHLCAFHVQNDALEATLSHNVQAQRSGVRIEKFKAQKKEILMRSVLNLFHSLLSLFF